MKKEERTNGCFAELQEGVLHVGNRLFRYPFPNAESVTAATDDHHGLSERFLRVVAKLDGEERELRLWDDLKGMEFVDYHGTFSMKVTGEHWILHTVKLYDATDHFDTLASDSVFHMFAGNLPEAEGNLFFLENPEEENAIAFVSCAPDFLTAKLRVQKGTVQLDAQNCSFVLGFCGTGECEKWVRSWCRREWKPSALHAMSNTWGDYNGFSRVRHDFICREIETAKELGIDIVQIDDGWQTGSTADPKLRDEKNRWTFIGNFWDLNTERFPHGIAPLTAYAKENGLQLGIWFAPDSRNGFALLERDKTVLKKAYDEWGARYFKLDMISILSETDRTAMLDLLETVVGFGDDVTVELDVTLGKRMGYLGALCYGTLFVENRYTRTGNAFPHRVLRNLWMLSHYLPAAKFQFELVNPDLNPGSYREGDPFVPSSYDMDYLFAVTMFSNPLFWMEMQFLSDERKRELRRILPIWREYREALARADVFPIGEKPGGRSMTGFCAVSNGGNGEDVYLLLFREITERNEFFFRLPVAVGQPTLLGGNGEITGKAESGGIRLTFSRERTYAFLKAKKLQANKER